MIIQGESLSALLDLLYCNILSFFPDELPFAATETVVNNLMYMDDVVLFSEAGSRMEVF